MARYNICSHTNFEACVRVVNPFDTPEACSEMGEDTQPLKSGNAMHVVSGARDTSHLKGQLAHIPTEHDVELRLYCTAELKATASTGRNTSPAPHVIGVPLLQQGAPD